MQNEIPNGDLLPHHQIPYSKCPKYKCHALTTEQLEEITLKAAKKAVELAKTEAYMVTGNFVITKVGYLIGFILTGIALYLLKTGIIDIK